MKSLKARFGKFAISTKDMAMLQGGHCPKSLQPDGACDAYWGGDAAGAATCKAYIKANC